MRSRALLVLLFFSATTFSKSNATENSPPLMLANSYHADIPLADYWISEKFDGVRAYWNGRQLISRQGHVYTAPAWFTRDFPDETLDGELWLQRGAFEKLSSIVRTADNTNIEWRQLHYLVFDAPQYTGTFNLRLAHLHILLDRPTSPYIQLVKQWKVRDYAQLQQQLKNTVAGGGEGLMLHRGDSHYKNERSDDLLKLKPFDDAEAVVLKHFTGKGKYSQVMGAMEVINNQGQHFRIGSGFTDRQRQHPPIIGSTITYRFNGYTRKGLPRFARFLRPRND